MTNTASKKSPLLEIENLSITVDKKTVLDSVSLSLAEGESLSIIGASGSGKSTLLKAIMQLLPHGGHVMGGDIRFTGQPLLRDKNFLRRVSGKDIAMVFQHPGNYLNPGRRIRNQYEDFLHAHDMPATDRSACMEERLSSVGFAEPKRILAAYPFQISGGERQRVAIAMTLSFSPRLILLDEPTSALDPIAVMRFLDRMKIYQAAGASLIFVTHHIKAGAYLGNRLLILQNGKVVETGASATVMKNPQAAYTKELLGAVMEVV